MTNTTSRRLLLAPLLVISTLVVGACGAPHGAAAGAGGTQVSRAASGTLDGNSPAPAPAPPPPAAPGAAPGAAGAAPAAPTDGTAGASGVGSPDLDSPDAVAKRAGMSPDQVAGYCREAGELALWGAPAEVGSPANFSHGADIVTALKPFTPAALKSDVALVYNDYSAIASTQRVYVQVKGELDAAFGRVIDFRHSICDQR